MKRIYRGHEITVEREPTLVSDDALHLNIFRLSDGFQVAATPYYGDETVQEMVKHMENRVDNEIEEGWDPEERRGSYEPAPEEYNLSRCRRLADHLQRQLPDEVRVRMKAEASEKAVL